MVYQKFKTYSLAALLTIAAISGWTGLAQAMIAPNNGQIEFSNYIWNVRAGQGGPGPNNWGDTAQDVFVDDNGRLHLHVSQHDDDKWYSSEVYLPDSLGYGKYTFTFDSRVDQLDQNLVAAPFLYQDNNHELDIEYSYWNTPGSSNLHYTVQPSPYTSDNQYNDSIILNDGSFNNIIDWQPDKVIFTTEQNGSTIGTWTYSGDKNFIPGDELAHINFWQIKGMEPSNQSVNNLIVSAFAFYPYVEEVPTSSPSSTPTSTDSGTDTSTSTSSTLPTTNINLQIETFDGTILNKNVPVTACPEQEGSTTNTLNAWCAIEQTAVSENLSVNGSWSSFGVFLSGINQYDGTDGNWWNWFTNLDYGQTSLNNHLLSDNDNLLLAYNTMPLRVIASSSPTIGSTTTITIENSGFDSNFNYVWTPAPSSTINLNGTDVFSENGSYDIVTTSSDPITIYGVKNGFITSTFFIMTPTGTAPSSPPTSTDTSTSTDTNTSTNNGGTGGTPENTNKLVAQSTIDTAVNKLINFIKSNQDSDGKIIDGSTSDWLTMAFASKGIYADTVKKGSQSLYDYVYNYEVENLDSELNSCAAYPRHILALLSSGVNKNDSKITALKNKLTVNCTQNNKYGQDGINDDIFGLLAALALDESGDSNLVQITLNAIKSNQQPDGGFAYPGPFESSDLTGAAVNALVIASEKGLTVDPDIFQKAKQYLKSQQLSDGGFGYGSSDALTTSWVMMGINALKENQNDWFNSEGKNPWYILTTLENDHFIQSWDNDVDWFGTKSAIPALMGKTWPIILSAKNNASTGGEWSTSSTSENISSPTSTTSTTEEISSSTTSTAEITTSTTDTEQDDKPEIVITKIPLVRPVATLARNNIQPVNTQNGDSLKQTTSTETLNSQPKNDTKESIINDLPLDTPMKKAAKKALAVTGGGAAAVGLYMAFRFLKNLL